MEIVVVIVVIGGLIGAVLWNHRTKAAAFAGTDFGVPMPPDEVASIVAGIYCRGAGAALRTTFAGVTVRRTSATDFVFETKLGDSGRIRIVAETGGSFVVAETTVLHIGGTLLSGDGSAIWVMSKALTNLIYRALGLAPNAARMVRFQRGVRRKVGHQVERQLQP